jgi:predicted enzyme related to lactoylglutathione lyase
MTSGDRRIGDFCWINLLTPEPAAARAFFAELLGWTYVELPGVGHGVKVGGRDIGGLYDLAAPETPPGTPAQIGVMVKVQGADATAAKATALGGHVRPPFDIAQAGRLAVVTDPNGAELDAWEPKSLQGTDVDSGLHGAPSWFETLTTDVGRAASFYSGLFGWSARAMTMPTHSYTLFRLGDEPVAGAMAITPEMGPVTPHWATYFTVRDVDETARLAGRLGARLCVPPRDIPDVGRFCGIVSPQGVRFYAITDTRPPS